MVARKPLPFRAPRWFVRRVEALVPLYASGGDEADASEVVRSLLEDGLSALDPTFVGRLHELSVAWGRDARSTFAEVVRLGLLRIDPASPVPDLPPEGEDAPKKQMAVRIDADTERRIDELKPVFGRRSGERVTRSEVVRRLLSDAVVLLDTGVIVFARNLAQERGVTLREAFGEILRGGADEMESRVAASGAAATSAEAVGEATGSEATTADH